MDRWRIVVGKLAIVAFGTACAIIFSIGFESWLSTGSFRLLIDSDELLPVSGYALLAGAILALLATGVAAGLRRLLGKAAGPVAAVATACVATVLLTRYRADIVLSLSAIGITALALAWGRIAKIGGTAIILGLAIWASLVVFPLIDQRRAEDIQRDLAQSPPVVGTIIGGAAFEGQLWLIGAAGELAAWRPGRVPVQRLQRSAVAIAASADSLWLLLAPSRDWRRDHQPAGSFHILRRQGGRWHRYAQMRFERDDRPIALAVVPGGAAVVTPTRLLQLDGFSGRTASRVLTRKISDNGYTVAASVGQVLYLGLNEGEFGGGLLRIGLSNGRVRPVLAGSRDEYGGHSLLGSGDPITALAADPSRSDCLYAAVGASHMGLTSGKVLRVCPQTVSRVFERDVTPPGARIDRFFGRHRFPRSEPVYGLRSIENGFEAVTPNGVYSMRNGAVHRTPLPRLSALPGLGLGSLAVPGMVLLSTGANGVHAMSGPTPLMFPAPQ